MQTWECRACGSTFTHHDDEQIVDHTCPGKFTLSTWRNYDTKKKEFKDAKRPRNRDGKFGPQWGN